MARRVYFGRDRTFAGPPTVFDRTVRPRLSGKAANWSHASPNALFAADNKIEAALILMLVGGNRVPFHSVLAGRKRVHGHLHLCLVPYQARLARTHNPARGVPYDGITARGQQRLRERQYDLRWRMTDRASGRG